MRVTKTTCVLQATTVKLVPTRLNSLYVQKDISVKQVGCCVFLGFLSGNRRETAKPTHCFE